jgi:hypothetical protein
MGTLVPIFFDFIFLITYNVVVGIVTVADAVTYLG